LVGFRKTDAESARKEKIVVYESFSYIEHFSGVSNYYSQIKPLKMDCINLLSSNVRAE
jgi:hypothetical protein